MHISETKNFTSQFLSTTGKNLIVSQISKASQSGQLEAYVHKMLKMVATSSKAEIDLKMDEL